jgi:hypothetical protein
MFIQLILHKKVYVFSLFGLWLRDSAKFSSSKVSSSSDALFATSFAAFGGLPLIFNFVGTSTIGFSSSSVFMPGKAVLTSPSLEYLNKSA